MNTFPVRFVGIVVFTLFAGGWAAVPSGTLMQEPANPNVQKLLTTRECRGCDFTGAEIINKDLRGVDLSNASFEGGSLYASDLTGANLTGVNFRSAVLRRTDLKGATLTGTDFSDADLSFASNANLQAAGTTSSTICPDGSSGPCR